MRKYFSMVSQGIVLSLSIIIVMFVFNKDTIIAQVCLSETLPKYKMEDNMKLLFKNEKNKTEDEIKNTTQEAVSVYKNESMQKLEEYKHEKMVIDKLEETDIKDVENLIGLNEIDLEPEAKEASVYENFDKENFTIDNIDKLVDLANLKQKFYVVDKRTEITPELFNIKQFLEEDLSINNNIKGPKVLIFHTHGGELYKDSKEQDGKQGVIGFGASLKDVLEKKYNIETIHITDRFDLVDGKSHILGAYGRMEPVVTKILKENPSIQVAIDVHRDGVDDRIRLVQNIDGKSTAQIMFVNGISQSLKLNKIEPIPSLPNKNLKTNLAFSFRMQLVMNTYFKGLSKKNYINAFRYSTHMLPKSLLVEVGAQTNTESEVQNAVEPLAKSLVSVINSK